MQALTDQELSFLNFIDVVGMSVVRAAELVGMSAYEASKLLQNPDVAHTRQVRRDVARHRSKVTVEDINEGIQDAIDDAKMICDPMAQIRGWSELARINGLDAPKKVQLEHVISSPDAPSEQLRTLSSTELAKLIDEEKIIDADFYEVRGE